MRAPLPHLPDPVEDYFQFTGGLDLNTPPFIVKPGRCRAAENFEIGIDGGYKSIGGYERFDGRPRPSDASYYILPVTFTGTVSVGDTITGAISGAAGVVIATTATEIIFTKLTGNFASGGEDIEVSSVKQAESSEEESENAGSTPKLHATYLNLAADEYRKDIAVVPGSGKVLGVWVYSGTKYAFRNNAGDTAAVMHKATSNGWTAIDLGGELNFTSGGTTEIQVGDTITGATSGATAEVKFVQVTSGTWAGGDAAGRFVLANQSGTFQSENLDVGGNLNLATISGDSTAITLLPNGDYQFFNYNFGGQAGTLKMYGVDGVNRGFEFDGTTFVPINTGMNPDTPQALAAHVYHLFFAFQSSLQHSAVGDPHDWTVILGAGEIAARDDITALNVETGSQGDEALAVFSRNLSHILYGTSSSDWQLVKYREEIGAYAKTVQSLYQTIFFDDFGVMGLFNVESFGNFTHSAFSQHIHSWINAQKTKTTCSCISRNLSQYRVFFSDNRGLRVTFWNDQLIGIMSTLFNHPVECVVSAETVTGDEEIYFGSDNGFVYQMDKGTSFDGDSIDAFIFLHRHYAGRTRRKKRYRSATLEIAGKGYAEIRFNYELGMGTQPDPVVNDLNFSPSRWDSGEWDSGFWDTPGDGALTFDMSGSADWASLIIGMDSDISVPLTITGATLRFIYGRQIRS